MPKTIFRTTEKSNFILNMRKSTIRRMIMVVLCAIPVIMGLCTLPEYLNDGMLAFTSLGVSICGIAAVTVFAILIARQMIPKSQILPIGLVLAIVITAAISMMGAYDFDVAFSGLSGRYEGFLTILCYCGIFLLGMQLPSGMKNIKVMDFIVAMGLFQCVIGAFQMIPSRSFNPYYDILIPLIHVLNGKDIFLPYGTVGSPIFLAGFLCLAMAVSACGACYDSSQARRRVYFISTIIFIVMAMFTRSVIGAIGMFVVLVVLIIIEIIRMKKAIGKTTRSTHPLLTLIVLALVFFSAQVIGLSKNGFYDGGIIWQDSCHRLFVTGTHQPRLSSFDASSLRELYSYLWLSTIEAMKKYSLWIWGTGPDCLYFTQYKTTSIITSEPDSFDRCYNDYLYIMATRGIPALIAYVGLLGVVLSRAGRNIKSFLKNDNLWIYAALFCVIFMYAVISIFNASVPTVAVVFWLLLGLAARRNPEEEKLPVETR